MFTERTDDTVDNDRVNKEREKNRSTWIDFTDDTNQDDDDAGEWLDDRHDDDWFLFNNDKIKTTITLGENFAQRGN
jgi:hypothetical protein